MRQQVCVYNLIFQVIQFVWCITTKRTYIFLFTFLSNFNSSSNQTERIKHLKWLIPLYSMAFIFLKCKVHIVQTSHVAVYEFWYKWNHDCDNQTRAYAFGNINKFYIQKYWANVTLIFSESITSCVIFTCIFKLYKKWYWFFVLEVFPSVFFSVVVCYFTSKFDTKHIMNDKVALNFTYIVYIFRSEHSMYTDSFGMKRILT